MSFTAEQLKAAEYGKNFAWDARKIPSEFDPVQLETGPSGVFDWWNTRGSSLCCFFPFLRCLSGHEKVDAKDLTHWKKQLASPSNKDCPESMQGLWWLKYNHAPEELVTIFGDCSKWTGTFNKEGTVYCKGTLLTPPSELAFAIKSVTGVASVFGVSDGKYPSSIRLLLLFCRYH